MKFEFIKKIDGEVLSYGYPVKTGTVLDLPPHLASKALLRPLDYRQIKEDDSEQTEPKRRGRPPLPKEKIAEEEADQVGDGNESGN